MNGSNQTAGDVSTTEGSDPDVLPTGVVGKPLPVVWKSMAGDEDASGQVTVMSAKRFKPAANGFAPPAENGTYLLIDVTILLKKGKVPYNPLYFKIRGADGQEYDSALGTDNKQLKSGDLRAGQKVRGTVAFDAPRGAAELIMSSAGFDDVASWKIKS